MSKLFSQGFEYDDLDDPVDLVLMTDRTLDEAIERAEEKADDQELFHEELIKSMQECGDLPYEADDCEIGDCEDIEDTDDDIDVTNDDVDIYRESYYCDEVEDDEEDEIIDTVIDATGDYEESDYIDEYYELYNNDEE